jgi:DNA polymerase-3 subunit alpha
VKPDVAMAVFQKLEDFAAYGFNKSHAACYAMIAYRTAYLKAHYPGEFMAALMNSDSGIIDRITIEVEECRRMGLTVLAPDINESFAGFAVVKDTTNVRWGLSAIKNVGQEVAEEIVRERKRGGPYTDLADVLGRVKSSAFNRKTLEALTKAGALDRFGDRSQLVGNLDTLVLYNKHVQHELARNQTSLFGLSTSIAEQKIEFRNVPQISTSLLLTWEKELLGMYVSSHPMKACKEKIGPFVAECTSIHGEEDEKAVKIVGVIVDVKKILTKKKQEPITNKYNSNLKHKQH